jgi:hypothetical protein
LASGTSSKEPTGTSRTLANIPMKGTEPKHQRTMGAVASMVLQLMENPLFSQALVPVPLISGAVITAAVAAMESMNPGCTASCGRRAPRTRAAAAATASARGLRPAATSDQPMQAVKAARHALGAPPANAA